MKKFKLLLLATAFVPLIHTVALAEKRESLAVSRPAQAINFTQTIDVSFWDRFSAQAVYSDGTPSSHTVTSGSRPSATITIGPNPSGLIGVQASQTINVKSTASISAKSVTLQGTVFTAGTDFTIGATTSTTAANLAARIDAHPDWVATVSGATVTVKYATYGTSGNGLPLTTTSSTNFGLGAATFSGGVNRNTLTIDQTVLTEGVDFNASSSSQTMAINLSTSINANATLSAEVVASTTSLGVVTVKSKTIGIIGWSIQTSSSTGFVIGTGFPGGAPGDVDPTTDIITKSSPHGFTTGLKILVSNITGTLPTGLTAETTYYAIKIDDVRYKLATSTTLAVAGTAVDITDVANGATTAMKPLALTTQANNGFFWEASNDNSNWATLQGVTVNGVAVSSVTYSAAGSTTWDFGTLNYKYIRPNFTGPSTGGITLTIRIFGKKD